MTDASSLTGAPAVPVILALNCLNGLFVDVYADSLAERLQKQSGGAAAIWASSGLTEPEGQVADGEGVLRPGLQDARRPAR